MTSSSVSPSSTATLRRAAFPRAGILTDALLVLGGALFVAVFAQISIPLPFTPVPITGQTRHGGPSALHHLRHTWAVWSLRSGVAPEVVRALGGWSSTAMVHARYGRHAFAHELAGFATQLDTWRDGQASTPG